MRGLVCDDYYTYFSTTATSATSATSTFSSTSEQSIPIKYTGFEAPLAFLSTKQQEQLRRCQIELKMEWSAMIFTDLTGQRKTVDEHFIEFKHQLSLLFPPVNSSSSDASTASNLVLLPPFQINCHSGRDSWSYSEAKRFFLLATEYSRDHIPVPVYHETHRGRVLYNPWVTRDLVNDVPELRLTADYSHWVNVCERLIDSEADILTAIASRVDHIHARVGHEQGPQVNDPRAPEWEKHVAAHERWWKEIIERRIAEGAKQLTIVPEYGPVEGGYQPCEPHTQKPLANLDEIVEWSASRMRALFQAAEGKKVA